MLADYSNEMLSTMRTSDENDDGTTSFLLDIRVVLALWLFIGCICHHYRRYRHYRYYHHYYASTCQDKDEQQQQQHSSTFDDVSCETPAHVVENENDDSSSVLGCYESLLLHMMVCPKRRQRFLKCARRCRRKQQHQHQEEEEPAQEPAQEPCWMMQHCASTFGKMHLPPPLPFVRRRRRRRGRDGGCPHQREDCQKKNSNSNNDCCDCPVTTTSKEPTKDDATDTFANLMPKIQREEEKDLMPPSNDDDDNEDKEVVSHKSPSASTTTTATTTAPPPSSSSPLPTMKPKQQRRKRQKQQRKRRKQPSVKLPRTTLMNLVRMQQWKTIMNHPHREALFHRRNARYRDADGLYPLHWACSGGPPVAIVQALLEAYPSAARKVGNEGSTALHFACHYAASPAVIQALVSVYPQAAQAQDKYGRTPLYHAVDKSAASVSVLMHLVAAAPQASLTPCLPTELRSIAAAATTEKGDFRAVAFRTPLFLAWSAVLAMRTTTTSTRQNPSSSKTFAKARLLLETAAKATGEVSSDTIASDNHTNENSRTNNNNLLCAALKLDLYLPEGVVPLLLQQQEQQAAANNKNNSNNESTTVQPLLVAAATRPYSPERAQTLWTCLLEYYSVRDTKTTGGQSPLAAAVMAGQSWKEAVQPIFVAAPEALRWRDEPTQLPPALLAAAATTTTLSHQKDDDAKDPQAAASHSLAAGADDERTSSSNNNNVLMRWLQRNDPYRLLTRKNREVLRQRLEEAPKQGSSRSPPEEEQQQQDAHTAQLETIYQLLRADPMAAL